MTGKEKPGPRRIFRAPLALAVASLIGLIAALIFDGTIDAIWNLMIALPLIVILIYWARRRRPKSQ